MKTFEKIISIILAVLLLIGILPVFAEESTECTVIYLPDDGVKTELLYANEADKVEGVESFASMNIIVSEQFAGGSGTAADPYQVSTPAQLNNVRYNLNKCFIQINDINLDEWGDWTPLGSSLSNPFSGKYNGNGFVVSNMKINSIGGQGIALFGYANNAEISNLGIINSTIKGFYVTAGFVGYAETLNMYNCYFSGSVTGETNVGGLVGRFGDGEIVNCFNEGTILSETSAGGIVGRCGGNIIQRANIRNCYNTGAVSSINHITSVYAASPGGIAGAQVDNCTISNCYNTGTIISNNTGVGGIVGWDTGSTANSFNFGDVSNTCNYSGKEFGSISGYTQNPTDNYRYINAKVQGVIPTTNNPNGKDGGIKTAEQLSSKSTYEAQGWVFDSQNWAWDEEHNYPYIVTISKDAQKYTFPIITSPTPTPTPQGPFSGGDGTSVSPYFISTAQQLAFLAERTNAGDTKYNDKCYKLGNDIDLSDYGKNWNNGKGWIPIGTYDPYTISYPFKGLLDGNNHIITGLYMNNNSFKAAGLIGYIGTYNGGGVKNLGVVNIDITGGEYFIGGVVGYIEWNDHLGMENCYATGKVSGPKGAGGALGSLRGYVENCYFNGEVKGGTEAGGLVGGADYSARIENCYSTGNVSGREGVGGIVGVAFGVHVKNCYATGAVSGSTRVGGLVGWTVGGDARFTSAGIENCAALNSRVTGNAIIGRIAGSIDDNNVALSNNIAFGGMTINKNTLAKGGDKTDGMDITASGVNADGTIGGRFTSPTWTAENGKLPGLFGEAIEMPSHLYLAVPPPSPTPSPIPSPTPSPVITPSPSPSPIPGLPDIKVDDVTGRPGETVSVNIIIGENSDDSPLNMGAGSFNLEYDPNIITPEDCDTQDTILSSATVASNLNFSSNSVRIAWISNNAINKGGKLITIKFVIKNDIDDQQSQLTLNDVILADYDCQKMSVNINSGILTVQSGLLGDVNNDKVIDLKDAIYILKFDVGLENITSSSLKNADVNKDNQVNILDAYKILKYDAGLTSIE